MKINNKRIKIGDVFVINTKKGNAYLQFVYDNKNICELVRILPGLYQQQPDISKLVLLKEKYCIHFPIKGAAKKGIVINVGNYPIPINFEIPNNMRTDFSDSTGKLISWHIIDYNTWNRKSVIKLNENQIRLSPFEIWNDTLLVERLEDEWDLEKWI